MDRSGHAARSAVNRRDRLRLIGVLLLTALALAPPPAVAQEASPAASPVAETDLDERIGAIPPEDLLAALLDTPVEADRFPGQYPDVGVEPWDDPDDTDLAGAVGGVLVTSGNTLLGVYIVHPSEESATARFEDALVSQAATSEGATPNLERVTVASIPAWQINPAGSGEATLVTLRVENVIVAGSVMPGFDIPGVDLEGAAAASAEEVRDITAALVDHLDHVSTDLGR